MGFWVYVWNLCVRFKLRFFCLFFLWAVFGSPPPLVCPCCSIPDTAQKLGEKTLAEIKEEEYMLLAFRWIIMIVVLHWFCII